MGLDHAQLNDLQNKSGFVYKIKFGLACWQILLSYTIHFQAKIHLYTYNDPAPYITTISLV